METPKQLFDTRVNVSLGDTASPSSRVFVTEPPIWSPRTAPTSRSAEIRADRHRQTWSPIAGLKPLADGIRIARPLGSPRRGQHERTRRSTGGVSRSQVDRPQGGTGARCPSTPALAGLFAAPALSDRQPRLREGCLNGLPESFAEVRRHRVDGGGIWVAEAAPTGFSDARFVVQPAYSLGPHSVSPLRRLAGGRAPSDPRTGNGAP